MKTKAGEQIRYEVDLAALPPLTQRQRADLDALAQMPDDRIDYSDLPSAEFHEGRAVRGRFYKPIKQQITTRRVSGQRVYPLSFKNFLSELYELISRKLSVPICIY